VAGLLLALGLAACAGPLPYRPAEAPAGIALAADYRVAGGGLRVQIETGGYRVESAEVVRPDGEAVPAESLEPPAGPGGGGLRLGVGLGGGWSSGGGGAAVGTGIGLGLGPGSPSGRYTVAVFPLDRVGPPPWLLRIKVVGVPPLGIRLDPK
jgi:hypothetical protein